MSSRWSLSRLPIRSLVLLAGLLGIHVAIPLSSESESAGVLVRLLALVVLCLGGYLLFRARGWVITYAAISIPALLCGLLSEARPAVTALEFGSESLGFLVSLLLFVAVIRFTLFDVEADRVDRVVAGVCGYLLLALIWRSLYALGDLFADEGFRTAEGLGHSPVFGLARSFSPWMTE